MQQYEIDFTSCLRSDVALPKRGLEISLSGQTLFVFVWSPVPIQVELRWNDTLDEKDRRARKLEADEARYIGLRPCWLKLVRTKPERIVSLFPADAQPHEVSCCGSMIVHQCDGQPKAPACIRTYWGSVGQSWVPERKFYQDDQHQ